MLSNLNPAAQQFLNNLTQITDRMNRAQQEITTGRRVLQVADAPDQISTLLQARSNLKSTEQVLDNLGRVKTEVDVAEQTVGSAVQLFEHIKTLGAQGNTGTIDASARAILAQQVNSLLEEMVGLSGTSVEGRFVFGGDSDQTRPYTYDATQIPPVSAYQGSISSRLVQHPNGTTFTVALTAKQIFDSTDPSTNAFAAIQNLSSALRTNNPALIQTAVTGLAKVADYLNSQQAFYGTTQNRVALATSFGKTLETQLVSQIADLQDADITQAILEMQQAQLQQQAALQSRAQLPRTTLFDFLG